MVLISRWFQNVALLTLACLPIGGCVSSSKGKSALLAQGQFAPPAASPTIDDVRKLIVDHSVASVDALLAALPTSYRSFYTLMQDSKSLQGASGANPRAIIYGHDASLIMTFNGSPDQKGYNTLEMLQFNQATRQFELYEATFPETAGATATLSERNPAKCLSCHTAAPRPNWAPYFNWPGAFGSEDDGSLQGSDESQQIAAFVANYHSKPRYRNLISAEQQYQVAFSDDSRLQPGHKLSNYRGQTNRALTILVFRNNILRLGQLLEQQSAFLQNKWLVANILTNCLPGLDPSTPNPNMPADEYERLQKQTSQLAAMQDAFAHLDRNSPDMKMYVFGAAGLLDVANASLKLGLQIDLFSWATPFSDPNQIHTLGSSIAAPFNDGSGDVSELIVARGLSAIDADFTGLDDFVCPDSGNTVNVAGSVVVGDRFCPDLSARRDVLQAKYGTFDPDGHKMICKVLAQRWLKVLAAAKH
ncbi:MAG: hypothetical protein NTZ90_09455 [Proteobacteria bacterium]|nr:hypothetical protein [Pseudomonadota bacterium]